MSVGRSSGTGWGVFGLIRLVLAGWSNWSALGCCDGRLYLGHAFAARFSRAQLNAAILVNQPQTSPAQTLYPSQFTTRALYCHWPAAAHAAQTDTTPLVNTHELVCVHPWPPDPAIAASRQSPISSWNGALTCHRSPVLALRDLCWVIAALFLKEFY